MPCEILSPQIIHPINHNLVAFLAAFEHEGKVRVFGNSCTHVAGGDDLAVVLDRQHLDIMHRYQFIGGLVLITAMFHRVSDQATDLGVAVDAFGADFNRGHPNLHSRRW